jgi:hypothetical protein
VQGLPAPRLRARPLALTACTICDARDLPQFGTPVVRPMSLSFSPPEATRMKIDQHWGRHLNSFIRTYDAQLPLMVPLTFISFTFVPLMASSQLSSGCGTQ